MGTREKQDGAARDQSFAPSIKPPAVSIDAAEDTSDRTGVKRKIRQKAKKNDAAKLPPVVSGKTRWSYCMQGAGPEEVDAGSLDFLTQAFGQTHPQWLIASKPWRRITGAHFKELRQILRMSRAQCAAFLRLGVKTIERWEAGKRAPAFAAFEALRLTAESIHARASVRAWDGWFMTGDGEWVSPNNGKLAFRPAELDRLPQLYADLSQLRFDKARLSADLAEATAENTRLRQLFQAQGVTKELRRMHERIGDLLAGINTADIVEFDRSTREPEPQEIAA